MEVADNQRKENRVLKNTELQQHYQAMFDMFESDGWRRLMEDAGRVKAVVSSLDSVDAEHSVDFRRGERSILTWIMSQRQIHEMAYDALLEEGK